MEIVRYPSSEALGQALAGLIAEEIAAAAAEGRHLVLGCPGGRSPMSTYEALAQLVAERSLPLGHVVIAMMDDYAEQDPDGGFRVVDDTVPHSCRRFAREQIVDRLMAGAPEGATPPALWLPEASDPSAHEERLAQAGIDLFLLASGDSDGHVAFNPPGSPATSRTRVVPLADTTRRDNLATFPTFEDLDAVPRYGVTVGIATIRDYSRRVVMIAHGANKVEAVRRIAMADAYNETWPATIVVECQRAQLYTDDAASGGTDGD